MPTTKHRITLNLSDSEYNELAALAQRHNVSMAWIGQKAILDFLEHNRTEDLQLGLAFTKRPERTQWLKNEPR